MLFINFGRQQLKTKVKQLASKLFLYSGVTCRADEVQIQFSKFPSDAEYFHYQAKTLCRSNIVIMSL